MDIVYAVDVKMSNDGEEFERTLATDISSMNILACSCYYLFASSKLKFSPHLVSTSLQQAAKSSFCVYVCALEQPWHFSLIATSQVPIVHLVWSLDGTHLLVCNQTGVCRIFKMKNGCINTMDIVYQYETSEDILTAKYMFYKEPIIVNLERKDSLFYGRETGPSSMLQYALQSGSFVCVTTSGTVHTLPLNRSLPPNRYSLSQHEPLSVSLSALLATDKGFNVVLGERTQGALIHFFVVHYAPLEPKLAYISCRRRGFRIPSCYGTLQSLVYFQRHGNDCVLTHMSSSTGDLIDLYEYNLEQEEWISITLLNSPHTQITSISLSPSQLFVKENEFQGQFGRQIVVSSSDGSLVVYDKLSLKCREQCYPMLNNDLFAQANTNKTEYFVRIQHTSSGACCLGFTQTGVLVLLRTVSLEQASSPSMQQVLVHLLEQWIVQDPSPCDIWDLLCLLGNPKYDGSVINELVDQLVQHYDSQSLELKRTYFSRFKQCLYHLHRLASPFLIDCGEHLTSLLVYHILQIVRDYLRLFIYEPTNRDFVESAQEILQQTTSLQNLDFKRIKYLGDQPISTEPLPVDPRHYQLISFTSLVNWISDIVFYLVGYLQLQQVPQWLTCKYFFNDARQIHWLRELLIYFYVLHKMNKIPSSKMAHLQPLISSAQPTQDPQQQSTTPTPATAQKDILKDIYNSVTKLCQKIEAQKTGHSDESLLEEFSVLDVEMLQAKADGMFPKAYPYLIPNSHLPQAFIRGQAPPFAVHLYGSPITADLLGGGSSSPFSSYSATLLNDDNLQDTKFDVISLNKISLSSSPTFRRCLRCSNFSRVFKNKPYPFLTYRLNHRCLCGGLFLLYTRTPTATSSSSSTNNGNTNSSETANSVTGR